LEGYAPVFGNYLRDPLQRARASHAATDAVSVSDVGVKLGVEPYRACVGYRLVGTDNPNPPWRTT